MDTNRYKGISPKENIKMAIRGISGHKMRSFLTMLGIIIGIAAIIAIVSTIKGTNEQVKQNLIGSGTNMVRINLNQGDFPYEFNYQSIPDGITTIQKETVDEIKELSHVTSVSLFRERRYADSVFHASTSLNGGSIVGIDDAYLKTAGFVVSSGRGFSTSDFQSFRKVALIDENAVQTLFASESPIGKTIEIQSEPFTVVGVVRKEKHFEPVIESVQDYMMYVNNSAGTIYLPTTIWPILYQFDEPECVLIGLDQTDAITTVGQKAAEILNRHIKPSDESIAYAAEDLLKQAENLQALSRSTNNMLIWIAAISLLVGGIGVMNIMLVSVTERTREIGLKKALGARRKTILAQFLTEAAVLTSIGGVIGILFGVGLAYLISFMAQVPVAISWPSIIISFIFSAFVGIVFGLLPSIKASQLDPIEALRYE